MKLIYPFLIFQMFSVYLLAQNQIQNEWITYFEQSDYLDSPSYSETMQYFKKIADYSDKVQLFSFGISPQGRNLNAVIISEKKKFSPTELKATGLPLVMIINGIHSGEIEGKDASMLLLREILITKEKSYLTENANLMIIPIFNVDGHERSSPFNRINQNGPTNIGWRTTAQNYNLNRDWMKADAPEMQAMLKLISEYDPDFLIDTHTTDGADYQYTVTYSVETYGNIFYETASWLNFEFIPFIEKRVSDDGYLIHPYVSLKNWSSGLDSGIVSWASAPRFSTGYMAIRNRPALLIETHMIKPFKDRVYSTRSLIEAALSFVNQNSTKLIRLNKKADELSISSIEDAFLPLTFSPTARYIEENFEGYEYKWEYSEISGTNRLIYSDTPATFKVKHYNEIIATDSVKIAKAYLIPPEYGWITHKLRLHGIKFTELLNDTIVKATIYKLKNVRLSNDSYESHQLAHFQYETFTDSVKISSGYFFVPTNQKTSKVITHLLEPEADDSFVKWGFLNNIFEQKEYFESYVMEDLAREMIENNRELKRDFFRRISEDETFRKNPYRRLNFFYERSPYRDEKLNLYPVLRLD